MPAQESGTLQCCVTIEWMNDQRSVLRKVIHKTATLRLIRNSFREIFLEIEEKIKQKYSMKGISVHKKFMSEGKASINSPNQNMVILISNAPPASLLGFLKILFIKMSGQETTKLGPRERVMATKKHGDDEISPLTMQEIKDAKVKAKIPDVTPPSAESKKRPLAETNNRTTSKSNVVKKLCVAQNILTNEQKKVLNAAMSGTSIFFTGSAGTGKSFLLRRIIAALPPDVTMATASTGVAACLIGGTTLHSFAGIGKGSASIERCIEMASRPTCKAIWRKCRHLIVDEISMVDGAFFEKLEHVARVVRNNDKPFGGLQLILCGDFFQLAPVCKDAESMAKRFCFQTPAWNKCINQSFELEVVHRQTDRQFIDILQSIRMGQVTPAITKRLLETSNQTIERDGILATRLCSHTEESNCINTSKLEKLEGPLKRFVAVDSLPELRQQLDLQTPVASVLELKVGAQVMLVKNSNVGTGLVNGARGVVTGYNAEGLPMVRFRANLHMAVRHERWVVKSPGGGVVTRKQIPLKLAWAFSIHKSQGLTLDCVEMSLARVFEAGQAYVALSRARSLDSLRVLDFDGKQVWANADVKAFYKKFRSRMEAMQLYALGRRD